MRAFWWLVMYRVRDAIRTPSGVLIHFGLPVILLMLTGGLFLHGHPFERRTLAVVGDVDRAQTEALSGYRDLRVSREASLDVAARKLQAGAIHAVYDAKTSRVIVTSRDALLGKGIESALDHRITLVVTPGADYAYLRYLFPGVVTWTVLVSGLLGMGYAMARYRRNGFLTKLRTTPLSRASFVGAQIAARAALVSLQLVILAAIAGPVFHLPLALREALWAAAITALGLVVFAGIGFFIAASLREESSVAEAANAATAVMLLLSEVFFPIDELPRPLAIIASLLPSTAFVRALRGVLLFGEMGLSDLGPRLLLLAAYGLAAYAISVKRFRWEA